MNIFLITISFALGLVIGIAGTLWLIATRLERLCDRLDRCLISVEHVGETASGASLYVRAQDVVGGPNELRPDSGAGGW